LDCSPTNRERELGLDRRETGYTRGTAVLDNWFLRLSDQQTCQQTNILDSLI
ncbi:hypothetical protein EJ07DRAFT_137299, partial [Lizonia empirigonia]